MSEFSVPVKLVKWIMKHVDPLLSEFRYKNRVIVFNRELICKILGLENNARVVRLTGDSDEVNKLREVYRDGERAKISKCISLVKSSKDRESFMRAFTLLALGSVYNPGTGNYVSLKYLNSLVNVDLISTYDWAGHIIEELMDEIKKYQKFTPERLEKDHQIGSCLIILAIACMDYLDLPSDRGGHQINYNLPRICNVTNDDFNFVMAVDKNRMSLGNSFGKLPFRDISRTPYADVPEPCPAAPASAPAPSPGTSEEVPIISSLDEWLQQPPPIDSQQIPLEYQKIAAHYSRLMDEDVCEIAGAVAKSLHDQIMTKGRQRQGEMLAKMAELANLSRNNVDGAAPPTTDGDVGTTNASTSAVAAAEGRTSDVNAPGTSTSVAGSPSDKRSNDSSLYDDLPSFDLLKSDGIDDDCLTPPEITHTAETTINDNEEKKPGSSTNDKKNRRKRAAINLNQGKKAKKLRLDEETKSVYEKYISKRILKKPHTREELSEEAPPFVRIAGFHVCYEQFYKSFKPKGEIDNQVMTLWTNQFNIEEGEVRAKDKTIVKKYAFSCVLTDKLIIDPQKFVEESCNRILTCFDKTWDLSKMDLLCFPIIQDRHWVLVCVNIFLNQISWFNPLNASKDTICYDCAQNLVINFSKACKKSGVLRKDVSAFEWNYPKDYPQQDNLHDCGLYTMLYMESWNGKKMETTFQPHMMGDYRKFSAGILLLSEIKTSEFVEKYCNQK